MSNTTLTALKSLGKLEPISIGIYLELMLRAIILESLDMGVTEVFLCTHPSLGSILLMNSVNGHCAIVRL